MLIYEVFYIEEEIIDGNVWEDDYHDDYYDYTIEQHIPIKYFQKQSDAEKYCIEHTDHDYVWQEIEVE